MKVTEITKSARSMNWYNRRNMRNCNPRKKMRKTDGNQSFAVTLKTAINNFKRSYLIVYEDGREGK